MPVVTVDWWTGRSEDDRARTVERVTRAVADGAHCPPEAVTVILREVEPSHWGKGGELASSSAH
ncbi:tautomerase family protein [Streptomyces sp. NPDC001661]